MAQAVIAKRYIGAVRVIQFDPNSYMVNTNGLLASFKINGDEYSYYRTTDFSQAEQDRGVVYSGYYKVEDFSNHRASPDFHTLAQLKKKRFENFIPAQNGDTIDIRVFNTALPHDLYTTDHYSLLHDENNDYVISGKLNLTVLGTPVTSTNDQGLYAEGFYTHQISGIDNITDPKDKEKYLITVVFSALHIGMIDSAVFPILLDGGENNIDTTIMQGMITTLRNDWENNMVVNNLTIEELSAYYNNLVNFYSNIFLNQVYFKNLPAEDRVLQVMRILPASALLLIDVPTKIKALKSMVVGDYIDSKYYEFTSLSKEDEDFVIKIINSIDINNQTEVDEFLGELINENFNTGNTNLPPYQENLYTLLYDFLEEHKDDYIGWQYNTDNRTRFVYAILFLWSESKYNPYKVLDQYGNPDYTLIDNQTYSYDNNFKHYAIIDYISEKGWFGTFNDKFTFTFGMHAHGIYYITDEEGTWVPHDTMHFYQPITTISYPSETDVSVRIPKLNDEVSGAIPLFFLKYVDDDGDMKSFWIKFGVFVDIVTTLSGLGNLAKLRHLRHLSKLGQLWVIIESVQIVAGVINLMLSYSDACSGSEFCKKLKRVLTFIEITGLISDPIAIAKTKRAAQEVVEEGVLNGWPAELLDNMHGKTPKQSIEELAELGNTNFWTELKYNIENNFAEKLNQGNLDLNNVPRIPPLFELNHTNAEIENIINQGLNSGLSQSDIEALLFISCRKEKLINSTELITQIDNWKTIRSRGYPYKFNDLAEFETFKNSLKNQLDDWDIPSENIGIQGSSLRTPNARDVDVAILISQDQMASIKHSILERYKMKYSEFDGSFSLEGKLNYDVAVRRLEEGIDKGIIKNYQFGILEGQSESFMTELYEIRQTYPNGQPLNVAIIIEGGSYDTPPYLNF